MRFHDLNAILDQLEGIPVVAQVPGSTSGSQDTGVNPKSDLQNTRISQCKGRGEELVQEKGRLDHGKYRNSNEHAVEGNKALINKYRRSSVSGQTDRRKSWSGEVEGEVVMDREDEAEEVEFEERRKMG